MKFFALKHPIYGYLAGNPDNKHFVPSVEICRKFNRRSDATNCKNTSYRSDVNACEVEEIEYCIVNKTAE